MIDARADGHRQPSSEFDVVLAEETRHVVRERQIGSFTWIEGRPFVGGAGYPRVTPGRTAKHHFGEHRRLEIVLGDFAKVVMIVLMRRRKPSRQHMPCAKRCLSHHATVDTYS